MDVLILAKNAGTSPEMIDKFYGQVKLERIKESPETGVDPAVRLANAREGVTRTLTFVGHAGVLLCSGTLHASVAGAGRPRAYESRSHPVRRRTRPC